MKTIKLHPSKPDLKSLSEAANIILNDGVIGYPTETVYGLGANAFSSTAIEKIFQLKKREKGKPILIIDQDLEHVQKLVASFPDIAFHLARQFWPGPLTMVLNAAPYLNRELLGYSNRIGIRVPGHTICLELLKLCGVPITSTSANISGERNPTSAGEVLKNFGDKLDLIIDGGKSMSQIASTVVSVEDDKIVLIREGAISKQKIEKAIGNLVYEKKEQ